MSLYSIQDTTLTDIADAIRSKTGKTANMTPIEMPDEIESISGGGNDFIVTITEVGGVWTPDKTFAEIQSAYNSGKKIATYNDNYETQGYYNPPSEGMISLPANFIYSIVTTENSRNIYKYYMYDENGISDDGEQYSYFTFNADAVPSDVTQGKIFYNADGQQTGTATTPTGSVTITSNGTHDVTNYASAIVNVEGGGGSSAWTKVAETSYQVSTKSTSSQTVATWATGHSELWTSDKWVYVRIRDTAGKRAGYFYGSDQFFLVPSTTSSSTTMGSRFYTRCNSSGTYTTSGTFGTTGYGVYADMFYNDGSIRIQSRYSNAYSLTLDGTYKVEVYLLDPAGGIPIFE